LHMSIVDSVFEAMSGITTTGSTVMVDLHTVPSGLLLWRSLLQWMGGIGIIVMAVAIMPHLRVGGMRLFRAEASDKSEKFTARSSAVAQSIGIVYLALSIACAFCYWISGMDGFNAILHSMTTVSTGGYSTSDMSIRQFASPAVLWTSCIFMFLSGMPFVLLGQLVRGEPAPLLEDQQVRGYAVFVGAAILATGSWIAYSYGIPIAEAFSLAAFNTISIITTTGYTNIDYNVWGGLAVGTFFFLTFTGSCAGSTAGGIKIFRFQIGMLMLRNQVSAMVHPRVMSSSFYNGKPIVADIITSVIAFSFVFAGTVAVVAVALSITGLDLITSLSGAATAVANVGPGLGDTIGPAGNFLSLSSAAKWIIIVAMLAGRLEILTVLVIFTPVFWRG
jgi:trk system potassium uptake protein TrkH